MYQERERHITHSHVEQDSRWKRAYDSIDKTVGAPVVLTLAAITIGVLSKMFRRRAARRDSETHPVEGHRP